MTENFVDNFMNNMFGLSVMDKPFFGNAASQLPTNFMRTDVIEKEDHYEITVDLPGFKKEDVQITLEDSVLSISAEQSNSTEEVKDNYIHRERFAGKQTRQMRVPKNTKREDVTATFEDGVLRLNVKKNSEPLKKNKIDIG